MGKQILPGPRLSIQRPLSAIRRISPARAAAARGRETTVTPAALDAWLADPARFLPGNRMAIPGISDASDRDNLIAYLLGAEIPGPD